MCMRVWECEVKKVIQKVRKCVGYLCTYPVKLSDPKG